MFPQFYHSRLDFHKAAFVPCIYNSLLYNKSVILFDFKTRTESQNWFLYQTYSNYIIILYRAKKCKNFSKNVNSSKNKKLNSYKMNVFQINIGEILMRINILYLYRETCEKI